MGDVVLVDFVKKQVRGAKVAQYIDILQGYLCREDFEDFIEGINDPEFASTLEPEMNMFVNEYWAILLQDSNDK